VVRKDHLVKVRLFASLRVGRFTEKEVGWFEGMTVRRVLEDLAIDKKEVGTLFVNSRHVEAEYELAEGDTLSIFPLIGGG
jgi:molybdopterin converting factor small subunit